MGNLFSKIGAVLITGISILATPSYATGKSVSKAMFDAGYAPTSAKNPQQLTKSKAWQKLMQEYLPDETLIEKHKSLLEASKYDVLVLPLYVPEKELGKIVGFFPHTGTNFFYVKGAGKTFIYFLTPDKRTQLGALALAYKIKGKLSQNLFVSGEKVIAILNNPNTSHNGDGKSTSKSS